MEYGIHPSPELHLFYKRGAHQGASPENASVLFVGRDPNWAIDIASMPIFADVGQYLSDGPRFWQARGVHHAFMLPGYKGDGKRYHSIFAALKLGSRYAEHISFVELIGFPTTGMAGRDRRGYAKLLLGAENRDHLTRLQQWLSDNSKMVFISLGLLDDFKRVNEHTGMFGDLASIDKKAIQKEKLNQHGHYFIHNHFSSWINKSTMESIAESIRNRLVN